MKIKLTGTGSILSGSLSASALIDENIQIDVPNGYCKRMREQGVDCQKLDVILITHFHGDHYFDIPFLIMELGLRKERNHPLKIFGPQGLESRLKELHAYAFPNWDRVVANAKVEFNELAGDWLTVKTRNGRYRILAKEVEHESMNAYGFVIRQDDQAIGYTGDTRICKSVEEIIELSDLVVLDVSFLNDKPAHMGLESASQIVARPSNIDKTFLATHMTDAVRLAPDIDNLIKPTDGCVFEVGRI